jgi:anti-sigma-K factor RskA
MNYDHPELLDRLASEFVFGTLTARARRRFERLRATLPAADAAAREWEARVAPLSVSVPPAAPSPAVWQAIERRTGAGRREPTTASRWVDWMKPLLGFAFGIVATVGLVRLYPDTLVSVDQVAERRGELPQSYVGLLTDASGVPVVLVSSTRHGRVATAKMLRPLAIPAGKVAQLWALPRDGAPFPLGTLPAQGKGTFMLADTSERLLSSVPRLAVSFEDAPAAAGAQPSAFVLSGHCVKLW